MGVYIEQFGYRETIKKLLLRSYYRLTQRSRMCIFCLSLEYAHSSVFNTKTEVLELLFLSEIRSNLCVVVLSGRSS